MFSFSYINWPGVFLLSPWMRCQAITVLLPSHKFTSAPLYTWIERGTMRVKCLAQEHNTAQWPLAGQTMHTKGICDWVSIDTLHWYPQSILGWPSIETLVETWSTLDLLLSGRSFMGWLRVHVSIDTWVWMPLVHIIRQDSSPDHSIWTLTHLAIRPLLELTQNNTCMTKWNKMISGAANSQILLRPTSFVF